MNFIFSLQEQYLSRSLRSAVRSGDVAALVRSHMNGLQHIESTIEQTTETIPPSHKTITAAAMTTNRITNLRGPLHYSKDQSAD